MIAAIERFATAGMLRFRLRSRAAMARTMRLTGAAVAAFVVALAVFPDTVPILAPLTALLVVEVTLKDILTSGANVSWSPPENSPDAIASIALRRCGFDSYCCSGW